MTPFLLYRDSTACQGLDTLGYGGRPQVKFSVSDAMMGHLLGWAELWAEPQGRGCGCRAMGVAAGSWAWLQGRGRGYRAVGVAAGSWAWLQGSGRGCREVGVAAGQWARLQGRWHGCRAESMAAEPWAWPVQGMKLM